MIKLFLENFYENISFYFLGILTCFLLDKYIFSNKNDSEELRVIPENEEEEIKKNRIKYKNIINSCPKIKKYYMVIGVGGVGSKVVFDLIRSGVQKLKIIDYDLVTLSSLNRHAFAKRTDVGKFKSTLIKEYASKARPDIQIESIDSPLLSNNIDEMILKDKPDLIIDCIDDLRAKSSLYLFCYLNNIKIISSMGAGGKCDPTTIRYGKFNEIKYEILARRLRYIVRRKMKELDKFKNIEVTDELLPNFSCVYSFEKNERELEKLDDEDMKMKTNSKNNFNERTRSLPVFACMPSSFGHCLSSFAIQNDNF